MVSECKWQDLLRTLFAASFALKIALCSMSVILCTIIVLLSCKIQLLYIFFSAITILIYYNCFVMLAFDDVDLFVFITGHGSRRPCSEATPMLWILGRGVSTISHHFDKQTFSSHCLYWKRYSNSSHWGDEQGIVHTHNPDLAYITGVLFSRFLGERGAPKITLLSRLALALHCSSLEKADNNACYAGRSRSVGQEVKVKHWKELSVTQAVYCDKKLR